MAIFWIVTDTGKRVKLGNIKSLLIIISTILLIVIAILKEYQAANQELVNADFYNSGKIEQALTSAQQGNLLTRMLKELKPKSESTLKYMEGVKYTELIQAYEFTEFILHNSLPPFYSYKNSKPEELETKVQNNRDLINGKMSIKLRTVAKYSAWSFRLLITSLILQFILMFYQQIEDKVSK